MPAVKKDPTNKNGYYGNAVVSDKVKDHGNDPAVIRKLEEAKVFIREHGLKGLPGYPEK